MDQTLTNTLLGKQVSYTLNYDPNLLYPILRQTKREEIGVIGPLPFYGEDIWNAYELSWLNSKGKPMVALGEFSIPCDSPYIIESKSFKIYFNSLNQTKFADDKAVAATIKADLTQACGKAVAVKLIPPPQFQQPKLKEFSGVCIDTLDIDCNDYNYHPNYLQTTNVMVNEKLYSHLLKSNCLVTNQPDWGSVLIEYKGKKIDPSGLLRYIVSFRHHNEFHEQCVERIFMDILRRCQPQELTVYARYTRRGGLDINPFRTTLRGKQAENDRHPRQ